MFVAGKVLTQVNADCSGLYLGNVKSERLLRTKPPG